ncbi:hypothetical protein JYJ95_34885 [Corallococcus exiguus]|uniref:hypothetical protein n=1 Tax=Corallococcus exiguus TaxID=83462 RepID=UPI001A900733|nr:hypothetical protein [Corallococcus exiguus]MBN8471723.1 hypothetical protein [Corallococcus exiguus]
MNYFDSFYVTNRTPRILTIRPKIEVHAGNVVSVFVNSQLIYQQPWGEIESNFQAPAGTVYVDSSYLNIGSWNNSVQFDVTNFGTYTGLDYRGTCRSTPARRRASALIIVHADNTSGSCLHTTGVPDAYHQRDVVIATGRDGQGGICAAEETGHPAPIAGVALR